MDLLEWNRLFDSRSKLSRPLLIPNRKVGTHLCYPTEALWEQGKGLMLFPVGAGGCKARPCCDHSVQPPGWQGGAAVSPRDGFPPGLFVSPMGRAGCRQGATNLFLFQTGQLEPLLSRFSEEEELQMKRVLQRMDVLARVRDLGPGGVTEGGTHGAGSPMNPACMSFTPQRAMEKGVRLMVDAEQSYFQPAISRLTVEMQRRFNRSQPLIYNTYQCYLRVRLAHPRRCSSTWVETSSPEAMAQKPRQLGVALG